MSENALSISVRGDRAVRNVVLFWLGLELCLVALDTVVNYRHLTDISQFRRMANIAREDGIATWFSSMQLLLVSLALGFVGWRVRQDANGKWRARAWWLVSAFFAYLSFDDGAKVHERVATAVEKMMANKDTLESVTGFFPSYMWQLIFMPIFGGMGLFMAVFFWREIRSNKTRLTLAAAMTCYAIAVGLDFIEGLPDGYSGVAEALGLTEKFTEHYGRVLEEFLEMFGTTLFLGGFLGHFVRTTRRLDVTVETRG